MAMQDIDYTNTAVSKDARRSNLTMFVIMMGFTFFSSSMWVGQQMAKGLDFYGFIESMLLGGVILGGYAGALGYIGAETGLSFDLLSRRTFGVKGSKLPSAIICFTQTGWFGVGVAMFAIPVAKLIAPGNPWIEYALVGLAGLCMSLSAYFGIKSLAVISYVAVPAVAILGTAAMIIALHQGDKTLIEQFAKETQSLSVVSGMGLVIGSFISGATATPTFTRFAKSGKTALWITIAAFFIGNSLMFCFGAVSYVYVGGNDIFEVMLNLGLFYCAIIVLGLNIWTTNDNAIYSSGIGLSNIFGAPKKKMVPIAGFIGTVFAIWLYWNFCSWLNVLSGALPPIGILLILDYFFKDKRKNNTREINWYAVTGVIIGAVVANVLPFGIASINGMITATACYLFSIRTKYL